MIARLRGRVRRVGSAAQRAMLGSSAPLAPPISSESHQAHPGLQPNNDCSNEFTPYPRAHSCNESPSRLRQKLYASRQLLQAQTRHVLWRDRLGWLLPRNTRRHNLRERAIEAVNIIPDFIQSHSACRPWTRALCNIDNFLLIELP